MLNSLLGGCVDSRSDCNGLARHGHCDNNPYPTLLLCPIACDLNCGKCFISTRPSAAKDATSSFPPGLTIGSNWKVVNRFANDSVDYGGSVIEQSPAKL